MAAQDAEQRIIKDDDDPCNDDQGDEDDERRTTPSSSSSNHTVDNVVRKSERVTGNDTSKLAFQH